MQKITKVAVVLIAFAGTFLLGGGLCARIYAGGAEQPAALAVADDAPQAQPAKDQVKEPAPGPLPVIVQKPVWCEFTPFQDFVGRLGQRLQVDVRSPIAGYVAKVFVQQHATVRKGDPLFEVMPMKDYLAVQKAWTAHNQAAKRQLEAGKIRKPGLDKASSELGDATAAERETREAAERAARAAPRTKVASPVEGQIVGASDCLLVEQTGTEAPVIVQIASRDAITFSFNMDERAYLQYRRLLAKGEVKGVGTTVKTQLADEEGFPGTAVIPGYDSQVTNGTIGVHCSLPDPEHILLFGMFVRVRMPVGKPSTVLEIPEECLQSDLVTLGQQLGHPGGKLLMGMPGNPASLGKLPVGMPGNPASRWVWVVNDENNVERRNVEAGALDGAMRVIEKGLSPEDRVIVRLPKALHAGERVNPQSK